MHRVESFEGVVKMKQTTGREIAIVGGLRIARAFAELGLIEIRDTV